MWVDSIIAAKPIINHPRNLPFEVKKRTITRAMSKFINLELLGLVSFGVGMIKMNID